MHPRKIRKKILPVVFLKDQCWAYHLFFGEDGGKERTEMQTAECGLVDG